MSDAEVPINLTHHFLIAMPGMEDELFSRSVVYLCEHSSRGAVGLVINKPSELELGDLFARVELPLNRAEWVHTPVFQGGPVQTERGFVLHESGDGHGQTEQTPTYSSTLQIPGGLEMTTSRDVLEAISKGGGPQQILVTMGCAAWAKGQLESELAENSWLTVKARSDLIFCTPVAQRYEVALGLLGVDVSMLSSVAGHA